MQELELKYGCNPNQKPARIFVEQGELPVAVLNGKPGYINFMDALNSWQLVKELKAATGLPAAASFKHVSPAGAALGLPLDDVLRRMYFVGDIELTPIASAYARARGADRMSSFGDWCALSDVCDEATAKLLQHEVSDGIIAPGYTDAALTILKGKKKGNYNIVQIDPDYAPPELERKQVYGVTFEQGHNAITFSDADLTNVVTRNKTLTAEQRRDMLLCLVTLKYTQSNSVCYAAGGQIVGVGAGQQSRIHCTRLAGNKADLWQLRHAQKVLDLPFRDDLGRADRDNTVDLYLSDEESGDVLDEGKWQTRFTVRPEPFNKEEKRAYLDKVSGVTLGSDAFFPFGDNVERACRSGVTAIVQPGGSIRDDQVIATCDAHGVVMVCNGVRLFHH